ncbi:phosphate ABC transporter ATP-binding protein [Bradyrhizobium jicamae]|uniref:Phosphate ABC transporter ATP-binding protein n=1 Tax=Bradyrhizobium jicamae TaxID=280332 RepID=A0A0R3L4E7_9BRAD|nr:amino acid ABC transporter ATP-binding protein [Bradyrhizobium jicamae]KRR02785.1 phosphate ABC transporter ATP-binding protein [Bradyrhizobium jicamae]
MQQDIPSASIVSLRDVQKSFGSLKVLDGVSFTVERGEVLAIIGRSGSGKSTALRCIDRFERVDHGEIIVCGHRVDSPDVNLRALRQDVGIVFQSYNLFPHLTIEQNITLAPCSVKRMALSQAKDLARKVLAQVGLEEKLHAYPEQLSGGQQQRAAIARSLAMQPKVMLFDEVTSALDPELTVEVQKVIERLAADGMTMVMVTHEMGFAKSIADRIVFMHRGKVHETGPASILTSPTTPELAQFVGTADLKS